MKRKAGVVHFVLFLGFCSSALAQKQDYSSLKSDTLIQQFDSLFNSKDSVSLLQLLDSLLQMPELKENSQMAIRLGYNSNVVATSRTIGFNQFGLAPGLAYYHKSGLYADATGYWSEQYRPDYYLTVISGGFLKAATKHWSFLTEYSHYFYSDKSKGTYNPYTNNVGATNYFDFKPVTLRLDYYFYFGEKSAHRIMPGVTCSFVKKKFMGFDRVTLFPSFNTLLGSENVISDYIYYPDQAFRVQNNLPLYYTTDKDVFGIMNYSFSLPLSLTAKSWNFLIGYTYNIPKSLPNENVSLQNGGYLSFSISRYLNFKSKENMLQMPKVF